MNTRRIAVALWLTSTLSCTREPPAEAPKPPPPAPASAAEAATIDQVRAPKGATAAAPRLGPEGPHTAASTSPALYHRNQKALEAELQKRIDKGDATPGQYARLAALHMEKASLDGDLGHADRALAVLDAAEKKHPGAPEVLSRRAAILAHLHRFGEAIEIRRKLLAARPDDAAAKLALGDLLWNVGRHDEAAPLLATPLPDPPGPEALALQAHLRFLQGDAQAADLLLRQAHGAYRDVHPMMMAWLDFQRGHLRLRTGRWEEARAFFRAAHDRLPEYVTVAEHLAEVEARLGNLDEALRLYDDIVKRTRLPEFIAARGDVLRQKGDAKAADEALAEADREWRARLEKHPTAWAAHAIGFWLDDRPDPEQAAKWAKANLEVRRDPMSLLQAARALAKSAPDQARALVEEARKAPLKYDEYYAELAAAHTALGETDAAREAFDRAKQFNPKTDPP